MADKKISALTAASTPLAGTEVLPIVQSGATVKVAVSDLTAGRAISATAVTASTGDITSTAGNFVVGTSGKGIDFSATSGAGTSELLADYEEGTWTPNQGGGLTVVGAFSSVGYYTKVGRTVTITGSLSGATSIQLVTAGVIFTNIPFTTTGPASGAMNTSSLNGSGTLTMVSGTTVYGNSTPAVSTIYFAMTYTAS